MKAVIANTSWTLLDTFGDYCVGIDFYSLSFMDSSFSRIANVSAN